MNFPMAIGTKQHALVEFPLDSVPARESTRDRELFLGGVRVMQMERGHAPLVPAKLALPALVIERPGSEGFAPLARILKRHARAEASTVYWRGMIPADLQAAIEQHSHILGSDECGLGSWAGPLSVCAVVVPRGWTMPGVTDSKKLTRATRERLYPQLIKQVTYFAVHLYPDEFDTLGAGPAFTEAHTRAIQGALTGHITRGGDVAPLCIIDGIRSVLGASTLPKADALIPAVSAASIIAKVEHDHIMDRLDREHPGYGLGKNAGYGTSAHQAALTKLGVSAAHRKTYAPMRDMVKPDPIQINDIFSGMEE